MLATPEDRELFPALLRKVRQRAPSPDQPGELLLAVGSAFLGTPFAARTLEQEKGEELVINLRQLDCFTFIENALVLTQLLRAGKTSFADFAASLEALRYRQGQRDGFASRLHYFTDWLADNQKQGFVREITGAIGGVPFRKEINFMTTHRENYPALAAPEVYARMQAVEKTCSARLLRHIPKASLQTAAGKIQDGDLLAITSQLAGLDVVHLGLAVHLKRGLHLLHASQRAGQVVISTGTLYRYLQRRTSRLGVMVARLR